MSKANSSLMIVAQLTVVIFTAMGFGDEPPEIVNLESHVTAIVGDTEVDLRLKNAAARRNRTTADAEFDRLFRIVSAGGVWNRTDLARLLSLDFHRPEVHLLMLEAARREITNETPSNDYLREVIYQEAEYLRITNAAADIRAGAEKVLGNLPARKFEASDEFLKRAAASFRERAAFHIEYDADHAIEVDLDEPSLLNRLRLPIRYVRSPKFPPRGCQVVSSLVQFKDDGTFDPPAVQCPSGYLPCAFVGGRLEGEYISIGKIDVQKRTAIMVYVATSSAGENPCGEPLSNSIAIAVVAKHKGSSKQEK